MSTEEKIIELLTEYQKPNDGLIWSTESISGFLEMEEHRVVHALINLIQDKKIKRSEIGWILNER